MNEFEISIKSAPHGAVVTVQGSTPTIVVQFGSAGKPARQLPSTWLGSYCT